MLSWPLVTIAILPAAGVLLDSIFPPAHASRLQDRAGFRADLTHMWRNWFEAIGKLPPMVQHFKKRRRK